MVLGYLSLAIAYYLTIVAPAWMLLSANGKKLATVKFVTQ
jgi:hypothetical protein